MQLPGVSGPGNYAGNRLSLPAVGGHWSIWRLLAVGNQWRDCWATDCVRMRITDLSIQNKPAQSHLSFVSDAGEVVLFTLFAISVVISVIISY